MARDVALACLVRYVHDETGHHNDDRVSSLVGAVDGDDSMAYTQEAHVQWRHRDAAQQLLADPPPREVADLLTAMREDLTST